MREYERALTTVANSYVQPQVARYVRNLSTQLSEQGLTADLSILRSDGGLAAADVAADSPVTMLMSGPAGGVTGAVWMAGQTGSRDLLTFDMGGTSTDVALVQGLKPRTGRETKIGDLTVRASSVDVRTVGAGGGSIAHVPELTKALRVGPQSAGADPGPAGYGLGGTAPTVTDANVVLGYLPTSLAGGEITLDVAASRAAVQTVADAMGLPSVEAAAAGIIDIVNENMLGGLRLVSVQQGFDPRDFALVAFGGAGPLHANAMGVLTGAWPVIVPPSPGVLCALGDATTSLRDESARTCLRRFNDLTGAELKEILTGLSDASAERLVAQGLKADEHRVDYEVDVRYFGQGFEIPITIDPAWLDRPRQFVERASARPSTPNTSGCSPSCSAPTTSWSTPGRRSAARGRRSPPPRSNRATATRRPRRPAPRRSTCRAPSPTPRSTTGGKLRAGDVINGPAIVVEMDSTTLILPGHHASTHSSGSLLIRPIRPPPARRARAETWHASSRPPPHHCRTPTSTRSPST